jgi:ribosomal-protein-alanine N-acetyltransferase
MTAEVLRAMLVGDFALAGALVDLDLPGWFASEGWLWGFHLQQIEDGAGSARWYVRTAATSPESVVIGHAGFHGPPDGAGMVEIGYTVAPDLRGRGYGRAIVAALLATAAREPAVSVVRASVSPSNTPSLTLVRRAGFVRVGEQWDDRDGLEWIFERPAG